MAKALATARLDIRYRDIASCTLGVVFSGTIHQPNPISTWKEALADAYADLPLHRHLNLQAPDNFVRPEDEKNLTQITEAFARIPGLLVISDKLPVGPEVGHPYSMSPLLEYLT